MLATPVINVSKTHLKYRSSIFYVMRPHRDLILNGSYPLHIHANGPQENDPHRIRVNLATFTHETKVMGRLTPKYFFTWTLVHWWALWEISLWSRQTRFFKSTFPSFAYSIFISFTWSDDTLWCTNPNWSSTLSFIQNPRMYATRGVHCTKHVRVYVSAQKGY